MRILSQNNLPFRDLPYENVAVYIDDSGREIRALFGNVVYVIAKYSTEAKAKRAMEMLRGKYSTLRMQEVIDRGVNQAVYERIGNEDKDKFFTAFFQFPDDDEVEV